MCKNCCIHHLKTKVLNCVGHRNMFKDYTLRHQAVNGSHTVDDAAQTDREQ